MTPATIQYLSVSTLPSASANSIQVAKMCDAFARAGHPTRLHAFAAKRAGKVTVSDVADFYGVDTGFDLALYRKTRLRNWLMAVAAARSPRSVIYGRNVVASAHASRLGQAVVLEIHHPFEATRVEHRLLTRLSRSPNCLGVVAISHVLKQRLATDYPAFDGRILVAPDAASAVAAEVPPDGPAPARSGFNVGYIGSLYAGKGFTRIVEIAQQMPWATFHVVGEIDQLRKRGIDPDGLPDNVVLHGHQPPHAMGGLLTSFDVVLAPYRRQVKPHEALDVAPWMSPLKLFEYMAAAKPIVASDLPVIREVLTHEQTALLCSADDDAPWVSALNRLAGDPDLARQLASNAQTVWARQYTWDARAQAILAWIDARQQASASG